MNDWYVCVLPTKTLYIFTRVHLVEISFCRLCVIYRKRFLFGEELLKTLLLREFFRYIMMMDVWQDFVLEFRER